MTSRRSSSQWRIRAVPASRYRLNHSGISTRPCQTDSLMVAWIPMMKPPHTPWISPRLSLLERNRKHVEPSPAEALRPALLGLRILSRASRGRLTEALGGAPDERDPPERHLAVRMAVFASAMWWFRRPTTREPRSSARGSNECLAIQAPAVCALPGVSGMETA